MPIDVTCECGKPYQVADGNSGARFRCKACDAWVTVPSSADDDWNLPHEDWALDPDGDRPAREPVKTPAARREKPLSPIYAEHGRGSRRSSGIAKVAAGFVILLGVGAVIGTLKQFGADDGRNRVAENRHAGELPQRNDRFPIAGGVVGKWQPYKTWTPDPVLQTHLLEPAAIRHFPEYRLRIPKFMRLTRYHQNNGLQAGKGLQSSRGRMDCVYVWRGAIRPATIRYHIGGALTKLLVVRL